MLYIIGLGLDDNEITLKGLNALKDVDRAFAEFYTNTETMDLEKLEKESGTDIEKLSREDVEQKDVILDTARDEDVAFLVSGDPLTATTHYEIKNRAVKNNIDVKVVHAPSIFTSIAETGLSVYRFGRTVTLPSDHAPKSIGEFIEKNDSIGLHTLVLFDIDLPADRAAENLIEIDENLAEREVVLLERANADDQNVSVSELEKVENLDLGDTPHCLIIVGEKTHMEDEFIEDLR
jgi:diphthine synthase